MGGEPKKGAKPVPAEKVMWFLNFHLRESYVEEHISQLYKSAKVSLHEEKAEVKAEVTPAEFETILNESTFLGGSAPTLMDVEAFEGMKAYPEVKDHPRLFAWYCLMTKFTPALLNALKPKKSKQVAYER